MGALLVVNGSPRASRSNSKRYIRLFSEACGCAFDEHSVTLCERQTEVCARLGGYSDVLLVFPLYIDGMPAMLMRFLQEAEQALCGQGARPPVIHAIINCGFLEPHQCDVAGLMVEAFCRRTGAVCGARLYIGSGEDILDTPFAFLVRRAMRAFVRRMKAGRFERPLAMSMPLPKGAFVKASTKFWLEKGQKNGLTMEDMSTMLIEGR